MTFSPLEERVAVKAKLDSKKEKKEKERKVPLFSLLFYFFFQAKKRAAKEEKGMTFFLACMTTTVSLKRGESNPIYIQLYIPGGSWFSDRDVRQRVFFF